MLQVLEQHNSLFFTKHNCFEEPDNGIVPMHKESDRLKSYSNWPCKFMDPGSLAKAGFYYVNKDDIVRCAFCHIEIGQWQPGDVAMDDHKRWSDDCPFVRKRNCGNIPLEIDAMPITSMGQDTCGKYGIEIRPNSFPERESGSTSNKRLNLTKLGIPINRGPVHPGYVTLEQRLNSFASWPLSIKQRPEELASAGFFYNGKGDQCVCFHCGGGLKDWEEHDSPWEQHAKWFSKCNYVILQKGPEYISEVCSKQEAVLTPDEVADLQIPASSVTERATSSTSSKKSEATVVVKPKEIETKELPSSDNGNTSNTNTLCKICYSKEVEVVFLPCGHIMACVDCALTLNTCAACRKPIEATVRGFLQ